MLIAVACGKKSQGNSKFQTRRKSFSTIGVLFGNAWCNSSKKFIKCFWFQWRTHGGRGVSGVNPPPIDD